MSAVFHVAERDGRWTFVTPEGERFWSIGMNHLDSATLRYPESGDAWDRKYGNSQERWLKEGVVPDLTGWGFNTIGWVQEVVSREDAVHRHSRNFTFEEYQWAGLPYCHLLPFTETHQWDCEVAYPDVFSQGFADWCDHVARSMCGRMKDDPKLLGYFFVDCPAWVHCPPWNPKGPWFDPARLADASGRRELRRIAEQYYQVTCEAIRRYDPHHLILGDRYEAKAALPDEVLESALPWVDVLSFQFFASPEEVVAGFRSWFEQTGKPLLLADACAPRRDAARYHDMVSALWKEPSCVGWHVCGAYLRNRCRQHGFKTEADEPIEPLVSLATAANRALLGWLAGE